MYRMVRKYSCGARSIAADLINLETQEMFRIPYTEVLKLASYKYIDNVSYTSRTNTLKSEGNPSILGLTVRITKEVADTIQYKHTPEIIDRPKDHKDRPIIIGIIFNRYEMRPCGLRVSIKGEIHECTLNSIEKLVREKVMRGIKVISYADYTSEILRPVVKQRLAFGVAMFYYVTVHNCRGIGITYEMAQKLFPGQNKIIDWTWSGIDINPESGNISAGIERIRNKQIMIPRGAKVRQLGTAIVIDNRMNRLKRTNTLVEYNGSVFSVNRRRLSLMDLEIIKGQDNGYIWLKKDVQDACIDLEDTRYVITQY